MEDKENEAPLVDDTPIEPLPTEGNMSDAPSCVIRQKRVQKYKEIRKERKKVMSKRYWTKMM